MRQRWRCHLVDQWLRHLSTATECDHRRANILIGLHDIFLIASPGVSSNFTHLRQRPRGRTWRPRRCSRWSASWPPTPRGEPWRQHRHSPPGTGTPPRHSRSTSTAARIQRSRLCRPSPRAVTIFGRRLLATSFPLTPINDAIGEGTELATVTLKQPALFELRENIAATVDPRRRRQTSRDCRARHSRPVAYEAIPDRSGQFLLPSNPNSTRPRPPRTGGDGQQRVDYAALPGWW